MKTIGLRSFYRDAPTMTEDVIVLHDRRIIGRYSPIPPTEELMTVDDIKKAIEPDKTKVSSRGRLSKGLGPLPGENVETSRDPFVQKFRPVPKPDKKK